MVGAITQSSTHGAVLLEPGAWSWGREGTQLWVEGLAVDIMASLVLVWREPEEERLLPLGSPPGTPGPDLLPVCRMNEVNLLATEQDETEQSMDVENSPREGAQKYGSTAERWAPRQS